MKRSKNKLKTRNFRNLLIKKNEKIEKKIVSIRETNRDHQKNILNISKHLK